MAFLIGLWLALLVCSVVSSLRALWLALMSGTVAGATIKYGDSTKRAMRLSRRVQKDGTKGDFWIMLLRGILAGTIRVPFGLSVGFHSYWGL